MAQRSEMTQMLAAMTGLSATTDATVLGLYLKLAEKKIMRRLYPFGVPEDTDLPSSLEVKVLEVAAYMINKRGAEGQTSHKENGVDRIYGSADVPDDMLRDIIPMAVVIGGTLDEDAD